MQQTSNSGERKRQLVRQVVQWLRQETELAGGLVQRPLHLPARALAGKRNNAANAGQLQQAWRQLQQARLACQVCYPHQGARPSIAPLPNNTVNVLWLTLAPWRCDGAEMQLLAPAELALLERMAKAMGLTQATSRTQTLIDWANYAALAKLEHSPILCWPHLRRQWQLLAPKFIVMLGEQCSSLVSAGQGEASLLPWSERRQQWHDVAGIKARCIPHPASLIAQPALKGEVWQSLQLLMAQRAGT